jgi:hypothetical protein
MIIIGYLVWSAIVSVFSFIFIGIVMETFQERELNKNDELWAKGLALFCGVMNFWALIDP